MLALVVGIGLSAFTANKPGKESATDPLHWFDYNSGDYMGLQTLSDIENGDCRGDGIECAKGYREVTFPGPGQDPVPVLNTYETTIQKE